MDKSKAITTSVNGPVVQASGMKDFEVREMVMVGSKKLLGEVISLEGDVGTRRNRYPHRPSSFSDIRTGNDWKYL